MMGSHSSCVSNVSSRAPSIESLIWPNALSSKNAGGNNWANFIDVVRSRKKEDLNAPIEEGHISSTLIHLANASYRLGRTINFDPDTQTVKGDPEAAAMLRGTYRKPYVVPEKV